MIREEIRELLHKHPFEPFSVVATSGEEYEIRDTALAALLKSAIFVAFPNSDRRVILPYLHVASVDVHNGKPRAVSRRRKR